MTRHPNRSRIKTADGEFAALLLDANRRLPARAALPSASNANAQEDGGLFFGDLNMPQWRKLHVKTLDSLDVNEMPNDFTRLTWLMLPLIADREGLAIDDPNWLRSKLFPLRRDVTLEMIEAAMCWFAERVLIIRYAVEDRHYLHITNFGLYQGNTEREAASVIPAPVKQARKSKSRPTHDLVMSKSMTDADADAEEKIHTGAQTAPGESDPIKELAAVFEQASGVKLESIPTKQRGPLYWAPLRLMFKTANGKAADELRAAVAHLRKDGMNISSPNSILKTFNSMHGAAVTAPPSPYKDYHA